MKPGAKLKHNQTAKTLVTKHPSHMMNLYITAFKKYITCKGGNRIEMCYFSFYILLSSYKLLYFLYPIFDICTFFPLLLPFAIT